MSDYYERRDRRNAHDIDALIRLCCGTVDEPHTRSMWRSLALAAVAVFCVWATACSH